MVLMVKGENHNTYSKIIEVSLKYRFETKLIE